MVAKEENAEVLPICAQIEAEIADMPDEDKEMFLSDMHLESSGLSRIIKTGYRLLGLISFLTAGTPEVRAWTITKGTKAPQAAGSRLCALSEGQYSRRKSRALFGRYAKGF